MQLYFGITSLTKHKHSRQKRSKVGCIVILFFALYKYSYLLTYLLTYIQIIYGHTCGMPLYKCQYIIVHTSALCAAQIRSIVDHRLSCSFWATFVKRFALRYRGVVLSCSVCLSCLSICDVGVFWPNGWTDQDETCHAGRPRPRPYCVRWGPSSR